MKKLLVISLALVAAQGAQAAILEVVNGTGKKITVVVKGSDNNYNSLNAQVIPPGAKGVFGGTGGMSGPLKFAFTDEMNNAKYNIFETYIGNNTDPEYAKLKTDGERIAFKRDKAAGYGRGYDNQTFPLVQVDFKTVTLKLDGAAGAMKYKAIDGSTKALPLITQVYPLDAWWQPRPWMPVKVKVVDAVSTVTGQQSEW